MQLGHRTMRRAPHPVRRLPRFTACVAVVCDQWPVTPVRLRAHISRGARWMTSRWRRRLVPAGDFTVQRRPSSLVAQNSPDADGTNWGRYICHHINVYSSSQQWLKWFCEAGGPGGAHLTKPGWSIPNTHSNHTNLALFRHKITLFIDSFRGGAHTIAGGAHIRAGGAEPP